MTNKNIVTTPTDERALRLLARFKRAIAVKMKGYWLCGGHRIAQATARRLVDKGLAEHPEGDRTLILPTRAGWRKPTALEPADSNGALRWEEAAGPRQTWDDEAREPESWAPPDLRDEISDMPVPVDKAMEDGS